MPVYNFKTIQPVPTAKDFVDIVLSKTQRQTPTVVHNGASAAELYANEADNSGVRGDISTCEIACHFESMPSRSPPMQSTLLALQVGPFSAFVSSTCAR